MNKQRNIISTSYLTSLIIKCGLLFSAGIFLTGIILYFSAHQPLGPSYQESFARLAQLKHEMLLKSIAIYCVLIALVTSGVVFITVMYSHRVVGPLVGLTRVIKQIITGDLTQKAVLRRKDAIQPMAETLNEMILSYKEKVTAIQQETQDIKAIINRDTPAGSVGEIRTKVEAIKKIVNTLKL